MGHIVALSGCTGDTRLNGTMKFVRRKREDLAAGVTKEWKMARIRQRGALALLHGRSTPHRRHVGEWEAHPAVPPDVVEWMAGR